MKMTDCKFFIDAEKRTVVCRYRCDKRAVINFIDDLDDDTFDMMYFINKDFVEKINMPTSFMGKAVCSPEDEWDEDTGMRLAYFRMKEKYYNSFFKRANTYVNMISDRLDKHVDALNRMGVAAARNLTRLEERLPVDEP